MKLTIEEIAKAVHEVNKAYCRSIGDYSQPDWELASEEQKASCINAVDFHMKNEATPEETHNNWMRRKIYEGWGYGEVKDEKFKEHPCIVPYEKLPREQQSKNYLCKAVIRTLMDLK